jgi:signal transduction histidine kinase/ligand-binding sensor domain-containing protein/CheY-like chemotaxis protein
MNHFKHFRIIGQIFLLLLLVLPCESVLSQAPGLLFRYLTTSDGLCFDDVRCIYQDKKGFMWFGTDGGVDRYDGRNFRNFTQLLRDTSDNMLQSFIGITEDSYGGIWFINDTNGLVVMNQNRGTFHRFQYNPKNPKSISSNNIRAIFEDSEKNLWITTSGGGLNLFNRKDSTFTRYMYDSTNVSGIGSNLLSVISEDHQGHLWITTTEGLLIKLDKKSRKFENKQVYPTAFYLMFGSRINLPDIYIDEEDNIWTALGQELIRYSQKTGKIKRFQLKLSDIPNPFSYITSILGIGGNVFMLGTYNSGLLVFDAVSGKMENYVPDPANPFGIKAKRISCIYRSRDDVFWIGSLNDGINIYSKNFIRFPALLNVVDPQYFKETNSSTYSLCEIADQCVLVGTENNGLFLYNPSKRSIERFLPEFSDFTIFDIFQDVQNRTWICTWINGLYCYHWNTGTLERVYHLPVPTPPGFLNSLSRVYIDHRNRIWMGSMDQGILMYDQDKKRVSVYQNKPGKQSGLSGNMVYKIFEDSKGNIWVGTASGLNIYDPVRNTFRLLKITDESGNDISGSLINDVFEDSKKRIWVATDKSLHLFDALTETFTIYRVKHEGKSMMILKILEDNEERLWLGTSAGPHNFDIKTRSFTDYGITDRIRYLANSPNAGMKSKSGYIYFGSQKGVTVFKPELIIDDTLVPPVYVTEIRINDVPLEMHVKDGIIEEPVSELKSIKLGYKQSTLYFTFAALSYTNPEANQYAYQLVGYDKDWILAGNQNTAYYPYLQPGRYVFKVRASNCHGKWNNTGKDIIIYIRQPFWRMLWFRLCFIVLIISIVPVVYYNRIHSLKRNKEALEGIVKERTKELNEANITLTEQHEELVQQHEEISTQNELLSQMSQEILKQNAELEQHRSNLENLVVERTKELEIAMRKAKESDRLKTAFLANMSHEIRTPMNAIVGFANLLKDAELELEERNEFIDVINANSEILLVLIDDILDLSLIEANQLSIKKEVFDVNEILDHLYSSYSLMNKKRDLSIRLFNEVHGQQLLIHSDKIRIKQILSNLINNAYKFTESGFIEIGLIRKESSLCFYVQDTGIGIDENEAEAVFERFRKSDANNNMLYRGAGLGLAISKALTHLLGGNLYVESALGKGSTFYFMLPESIISKQGVEILPGEVHKEIPVSTGKNILIVEDEQANYLYAKKMLSKLDVIVHWAENGQEALNIVSSGMKFHLILMDIKMPVMDGFEATKTIKENNPGQIVIALTAYARPEDRLHFMKAGFDDYLAKPIKPNDFMGVIRRFL